MAPTILSNIFNDGALVKLVVWDLDNSIWDGVLLEDGAPPLYPGVTEIIIGLDNAGILQSIASRNDVELAEARLRNLGIAEYFLAPQISWNAKSASIELIAKSLGIGLDAVLFIDDDEFELSEVALAHPMVRTLNAINRDCLLFGLSSSLQAATGDGRRRRMMYLENSVRQKSEANFAGTPAEFLSTLNLQMTLHSAHADDLDRAEELTLRTNQLNSTGITYSKAELKTYIQSETHRLLIADLKDRFGSYGKIGLVLISTDGPEWILKLILVSCRVLSRGIGGVLLNYIVKRSIDAHSDLVVEFRDTGRNKEMKMALMMAGFIQDAERSDGTVFRRRGRAQALPTYLELSTDW